MLNEWNRSRMKLLILGLVIVLAPLSAQTLTWGNVSDPTITPNFVVGDSWTLTISGAAANASIVLQFTKNGSSVQYYTVGTTDSSGNYTSTQLVTNGSWGTYTNVWLVNGVQLGQQYNYEVIYEPGALSVYSSGVANPNCAYLGGDYGVLAAITYSITNSGGNLVSEQDGNIPMLPYYSFIYYNFAGQVTGSGQANVGGHGAPWSSNEYANTSNGRFLYIPIGYCDTSSYPDFLGESENLTIIIGNTYYPVRSQTWSMYSNTIDHGTISNSVGDVTVSQ